MIQFPGNARCKTRTSSQSKNRNIVRFDLSNKPFRLLNLQFFKTLTQPKQTNNPSNKAHKIQNKLRKQINALSKETQQRCTSQGHTLGTHRAQHPRQLKAPIFNIIFILRNHLHVGQGNHDSCRLIRPTSFLSYLKLYYTNGRRPSQ